MKCRRSIFSIVLSALLPITTLADIGTRDPLKWPFASDSIWNMPIGSNAQYVYAEIKPSTGAGMTIEEDILILTPEAPLTPLYENDADWDTNKDRCIVTGSFIGSFPIPQHFIVSKASWTGDVPNHAAAILLPDGRNLFQTQPFSRCEQGKEATSHYHLRQEGIQDADICGDGIRGSHGGSGLSSIGGTIRVGELLPGSSINHALKVAIYGKNYLYYDAANNSGFRWPAIRHDSDAPTTYSGKVEALKMGALLALKPDFDINILQTEPAKIIARAFMNYGGYVVDDTAWDVYAIATEWGPNGRVKDEFKNSWGFDFHMQDLQDPWGWAQDMRTIFTNLHIVNNNEANNIGGGGIPRQALAPLLNCEVTNPPDTTPDAFSFSSQYDVALNSLIVSNPATISGINATTQVVINGGEYSIGCDGNFRSGVGSISNGQVICVRHYSANINSTTTSTTITIGGVIAVFQSVTREIVNSVDSLCFGKTPTIKGSDNSDFIEGTDGDDVIVGLRGNDVIFGKKGNDLICGGSGNDTIKGGLGNDKLNGDEGWDITKGGKGYDECYNSERKKSCKRF